MEISVNIFGTNNFSLIKEIFDAQKIDILDSFEGKPQSTNRRVQ